MVYHDVPVIFGLVQHHPSGTATPVKLLTKGSGPGGRLYIQWPTDDVLFTKEELRKLHTQFGHPSTDALVSILKKAKPENVDSSVRRTLQDIANRCDPSQTWAPRRERFRVSLPIDNITFNHEIEVDVMFIDGDPVLHIIDRGTKYSAAKFMRN